MAADEEGTRGHDYKRHGVTTSFAADDVVLAEIAAGLDLDQCETVSRMISAGRDRRRVFRLPALDRFLLSERSPPDGMMLFENSCRRANG